MKKTLFAWLVFVSMNAIANELPAPVFENAPKEESESGYVKLIWRWEFPKSNSNGCEFELRQSENEDFKISKTVYIGPDYATFLSGLKDGQYFYQVRVLSKSEQVKSEWSDPVLVRVKHHSLRLAFLLFGVGAIVFLSTVLLVVRGNRNATKD